MSMPSNHVTTFSDCVSLTIDLDSCKSIAVKKNGETYTLEDYLYKLILEALLKKEEYHNKKGN